MSLILDFGEGEHVVRVAQAHNMSPCADISTSPTIMEEWWRVQAWRAGSTQLWIHTWRGCEWLSGPLGSIAHPDKLNKCHFPWRATCGCLHYQDWNKKYYNNKPRLNSHLECSDTSQSWGILKPQTTNWYRVKELSIWSRHRDPCGSPL